MTKMQIVRRGLIAGLATAALAPASAMATHNGTCPDNFDVEHPEEAVYVGGCAAIYFADHHVDPLLDRVDPVMDLVQQLSGEARDRVRWALCFYFGMGC